MIERDEVLNDLEAHRAAMSMPIGDVVSSLVDLLGATTVAVIGGVKETRAVAQWMGDREPQRPHVLRFALQVASMISSVGGRNVARAWFHGANPALGDEAPMFLLRDKSLQEIQAPLLAATRAFAAREPSPSRATSPAG